MSEPLNEHVLSDQTKSYVEVFEKKETHFKTLFADFQEDHQAELLKLDEAREAMNAALDEAKRAMRTNAVEVDYRKIKKIHYGAFKVQKKWSGYYNVGMFVEMTKEIDLYDAAVDESVIKLSTSVNAELAGEFLRKHGVLDKFKMCEDGKEMTPAVTCPKPVAPFGSH